MRDPVLPLFLYGTLLNPAVLGRHGGPLAKRRTRPAVARGWRRVAFRGTPYPTLIPAEGEVRGLLLRPTPQELARLRRYEGSCYRLHPIRVQTSRGPCYARAFLVPRLMASREPW